MRYLVESILEGTRTPLGVFGFERDARDFAEHKRREGVKFYESPGDAPVLVVTDRERGIVIYRCG